jgi:ArsR family transcriptional regulator, arsenate/arsenite/antimonite-responsive transcriptional repressor
MQLGIIMESVLYITKALADGNRLRIIAMLLEHDELCVCQITEVLKVATPTVSRHMSVLQNAHLVQNRKDSRWIYYRISKSFPQILRKWIIESLLDSKEIQSDREALNAVLSVKTMELCKKQAQKRRKM